MNPETAPNFDAIWEEKYRLGHAQRYPWDAVVSFVFRHSPKNRERAAVHILEVGCGTASNLWFAAREGFAVAGVDASESAIAVARERFAKENLVGDLRVADFTSLPFPDAKFDLVIDRGALTCTGFNAAQRAIAEIYRVLKPGGRFYFNPYSDRHSSRLAGRPGPDGLTLDIKAGTMAGMGQICFYGRSQVEGSLSGGWRLLSLRHLEFQDVLEPAYLTHSEWQVVAEKPQKCS